MTEQRQCPQCGAALSPDAAEGLCPKCLLDAGLESQPAVAPTIDEPRPSNPATAETIPPSESSSGRFRAPLLESLGRQFPQLEILEHLGQGGMGVVYKARQKQLNRLVAVKILPPRVADDPAFAERFAREAQALAKLNHQNIVQVYDFGRTDEFFYFVMEYVDGVNLRALIGTGKLQPDEALRIVPQICEALQFAHDEGIVHRDIKPENILIDKRGRVKIADFGLAKLLGHAPDDLSLTGTGQVMGTLGYMAPEQLQQAHTVDHRADIFSLGVVFYEMLTGQLPMGRFEPPSKKVHVDVRLDEVVLRTLESEPDRRYQHASDVKTDVEAVAGTQQRVYAPLFSQKSATVAGEQPLSPARLKIPAIGLIVVGALHAACLLLAGVALWRLGLRELLLLTIPGAVGVSMLVGGIKMLRMQSYAWAVTAGILALLPVGPACLLGLPLGIWALAVLAQLNVKRAFDAKRDEQAGERIAHGVIDQKQSQRIGKLALVLCLGGALVAGAIALVIPFADELVLYPAIFVFVVSQLAALTLGIIARRNPLGRAAAVVSVSLLLIGLVLLLMLPIRPESTGPIHSFTAEGTGKTRVEIPDLADRPADVPRETPSESISRMWVFGTDGPKLGDSHARTLLKPSQVEPVNKAIQESFREYLALESQHRQQTTDEQGHMITSIQPLSKTDLETVENHLWSKLDPILDKEQQNIFRLNLELYPPPVAGGMFLRDIVRPGLFGWGEQGARVEIWREGTWYRWKVKTTHYDDESRAAELPAVYVRFWLEPASKK